MSTNHLLNDLSSALAALEKWGRPIYLAGLSEPLGLRADQLPLVVVANAAGPVVFASQGYTIGLGSRIASLADKL